MSKLREEIKDPEIANLDDCQEEINLSVSPVISGRSFKEQSLENFKVELNEQIELAKLV